MRGVNLGGWLVLERWMTPSLFEGLDAVDEMTYCQRATPAQLRRLQKHRQTFITKADFEWLADNGIKAVRIPVGHWIFGDAEPYFGTVTYLDQAFEWAEATGIKVLISLHGAPGSQNGNDHSGCIGPVAWADDPTNIRQTLLTIRKLAERYCDSPALMGISLLNEPAVSLPKRLLKDYYQQAYATIREICRPDTWVVISDSFQPRRWHLVLHRLVYRRAFLDTHQYFVFMAKDKSMPVPGLLRRLRTTVRFNLAWMRLHHPTIVGEWSAALDPGSMVNLDQLQRHAASREFCRTQAVTYDRMDAWFYWSYKTETADAWNFRHCHQLGWFDDML